MKVRKNRVHSAVLALLITLTMTGCQVTAKQSSAQAQNTTQRGGQSTVQMNVEQRDTSQAFTAEDFDTNYDSASSTKINVSSLASLSAQGVSVSGNTARITAAGTYILTGTAKESCIIVDTENGAVHLVLDNLTMSHFSVAPIYVKSAGKVYVTLAKGSTNTLSVNGEFAKIDGAKAEAVIFSQADLTLNGSGTLNVSTGYGSGIVSKKSLTVTGGGMHGMPGGAHGGMRGSPGRQGAPPDMRGKPDMNNRR